MGSETKDGANPFPAAISRRECEAFALGVRGQIEMSQFVLRLVLIPPRPSLWSDSCLRSVAIMHDLCIYTLGEPLTSPTFIRLITSRGLS